MLIINYTKEGKAFRDHEAERDAREAYDLSKTETYLVDFATENFLYAIRVLIHRGVIPHDKVNVAHEGEIFGTIDRCGRMSVWPSGFCDNTDCWLTELCGDIK